MAASGTLRLAERWARLSLSAQFALAGFLVLCVGMMVLGSWLAEKIEHAVTQNTASSAALYVESFIAPLVQELANSDQLHPENRAALADLLTGTELGRSVVSFKIWKQDGLIVYSSRPSIIGRRFPVTDNLRRAWSGKVSAEFDTLVDEEDALERAANVALLEMYCPIHEDRTGRIIAVAEFYDRAEALSDDLFRATLETWGIVALVTLLMFGALFGIVNRGSRTIERQQRDLRRRVVDLSHLLEVNDTLRKRVQRASQRATELNEQFLRRISADLHDGPAQLLSLALLRLDTIAPPASPVPAADGGKSDLEIVRSSLEDAITEVRNICTGINLPDLDHRSLDQIVRKAVHAHERRTGTQVELALDPVPDLLPASIKMCAYRFVQEGLNNAYRHAGGAGQHLVCRNTPEGLEIMIGDQGPGMPAAIAGPSDVSGLGLNGLRDRIESLGGQFAIESAPGEGTRLFMRWELTGEAASQ